LDRVLLPPETIVPVAMDEEDGDEDDLLPETEE
jgi:hypothetical protein